MPVVPEKRQLEDHVHAAVAAQFWGQGVENSRALSGQTVTSPCEPQPLRLTAPSGLSRTQFLVAARAVRLPIFPGYCHEHGGTVVDRVLLQSGSSHWWAALVGRGKLQRAWNQHTDKSIHDNLSDPDNYALAATGRLQLSDTTVLRATLQSDSLAALQPLLPQQKLWQQPWTWGSSNALHQQQHQQPQQQQQQRQLQSDPGPAPAAAQTATAAAADGSSSSSSQQPPRQQRQRQQQQGQSRLVRLVQGNSLKLQLKQQWEALDLTADLAMNEMCVDGVTRYANTPLRLTVDVSPSSSSSAQRLKLRQSSSGGGGSSAGSSGSSDPAAGGSSGSSWLQGVLFRVGVHGAVAPVGNTPTAAAAAAAASSSSRQQQQQREHAVSLHAQGALALSGSKTLWEAHDKPWQSAAAERRQHRRQQQQQQLDVQPLQVDNSSNSSSNPQPQAHGAADTAASTSSSSSSSSSSKDGSSSLRSGQQQRSGTSSRGRHSSSSSRKSHVLTFQGKDYQLPLISPSSVQETLQDATSSLERLRTRLTSLTSRVEAGELEHIGQHDKPPGLLFRAPGSCWSSFIPGPHFKVCGLIGLLGRVPLHHQCLMLPAASSSSSSSSSAAWQQRQQQQPSSSSCTVSMAAAAADTAAAATAAGASGGSAPLQPEGGRPLGERARGVLAASATHLDRLVLGGARKLGRSITQESLLRLFGSAGASLQVGEMRKNFMDFTRVEVMLDMGLNGPENLPQVTPAKSRRRNAASRYRTRAPSSSKATAQGSAPVRAASPARGMTTILGPAAAAAAAAATHPPLLPPGAAAAATSSSGGSPRGTTLGSSMGASGSSQTALLSSTATPAAAAAAPLPPVAPSAPQQSASAAGPAAAAAAAATGQHKHPAFALQERGVWHALTLSATQQLFGPVRLRADCRLALDSVHLCPRGAGLLQPSAPLQLLQHVVGVRPALVGAAYGVDVMVPGAGGLVRLVGWYSPGSGEGGLGLRLM